jgi:hypothetical protein
MDSDYFRQKEEIRLLDYWMIFVETPEYIPKSDLNNSYLWRTNAQSRIRLFHQKEM